MIRLGLVLALRHDEHLVEVAEELLGQEHDRVVEAFDPDFRSLAGSICGSFSGCWFTKIRRPRQDRGRRLAVGIELLEDRGQVVVDAEGQAQLVEAAVGPIAPDRVLLQDPEVRQERLPRLDRRVSSASSISSRRPIPRGVETEDRIDQLDRSPQLARAGRSASGCCMWKEWRPKIEPPIRISIIPTTTLSPTMSLMRMGHRTMTTSLSFGWAGLEVAGPGHGRARTRAAYTTTRLRSNRLWRGFLHRWTTRSATADPTRLKLELQCRSSHERVITARTSEVTRNADRAKRKERTPRWNAGSRRRDWPGVVRGTRAGWRSTHASRIGP